MAAKIKLKLDADAIKQFFILHSEKLVLGMLALAALLLVYKGVLRETYRSTPQELASASQSANAQLQQSVLNPEEQGIKIIDYTAKADEQVKALDVTGFEWLPIRHPVWPRGSLRGVPVLLAVEDLEVHAGRGAFDVRPREVEAAAEAEPAAEPENARPARNRRGTKPEPAAPPPPPANLGAGNLAGHRYVVILGRVPLLKQIEAYRKTFADAAVRLDGDEMPQYRGAIVERAEVVTGAANENLKWVSVGVASHKALKDAFAKARVNEFARGPLVDPFLTESLPPKQGQDFAPEEVVHSTMLDAGPEEAPPPEAAPAAPETPDEAATDGLVGDAPADAPGDAPPARPGPSGGSSLGSGPRARPGSSLGSGLSGSSLGSGGPARPGSSLGSGLGGRSSLGGQGARPAAPADAPTAPLSTADEALLFRYFDFTVEPGKQYRYRVKLWVANPNYGVEPSQLNDEARKLRDELLKKKTGEKFVLSPESKPSDPIYVPYDGVLVAGKWSPPTPAQEPSVSVGVEQWTANDGATAQFLKGKVYRGQLVNFEVTPAGDGPGAQQPGAAVLEVGDNIPKRNELPIPFRTEVAVLDMAPAPPEGGAAAKEQPADILVLDAAGRLRLYTAKEMAEQFQQIADNFGQVNVKPDKEESGRNNTDPLARPPGLGPSSLGSGLGGSSLGKQRPGGNPK